MMTNTINDEEEEEEEEKLYKKKIIISHKGYLASSRLFS